MAKKIEYYFTFQAISTGEKILTQSDIDKLIEARNKRTAEQRKGKNPRTGQAAG